MVWLIDLHVHTRLGSLDSSIDPASLVEHARRAGLSGIAVSEHYRLWSAAEVERWSADDVRLYPAAEVATDLGHVLGFGFPSFPAARSAVELAEEARACGGAPVLAHPFRGYFDSPHHWLGPEPRGTFDPFECAVQRGADLFDGIEVLNNGCAAEESLLAERLRHMIGCPGVAGSDAHFAGHIGRHATAFAKLPGDARELATCLHAGRVAVCDAADRQIDSTPSATATGGRGR